MTSSRGYHDTEVSDLTARLARASTLEEKVAMLRSLPSQPRTTADLLPGGKNPSIPESIADTPPSDDFCDLLDANPDLHHAYYASLEKDVLGSGGGDLAVNHAIREQLCANVDPTRSFACINRGTSLCSSCKLVNYCSKVPGCSSAVERGADGGIDLPEITLEDA